jgi:hypothetical protein
VTGGWDQDPALRPHRFHWRISTGVLRLRHCR